MRDELAKVGVAPGAVQPLCDLDVRGLVVLDDHGALVGDGDVPADEDGRSAAAFGSSRQESEILAWFMGRHLRFALRI